MKTTQHKNKKPRYHTSSLFSRKGQIKMLESISVLIIFMIILVIVMVLYVNISLGTSGRRQAEKTSLQAIEIAQFISSLPEFQCSKQNLVEDNCFDILKIDAFLRYNQTQEGQRSMDTVYFDFFKESTLRIYQVYPPSSQEWLLYDRGSGGNRDQEVSFIPINLYDPNTDRYSYGILEVSVYS